MMSEHQRGGAKRQPDLTLSLWPTTCVQEGGGRDLSEIPPLGRGQCDSPLQFNCCRALWSKKHTGETGGYYCNKEKKSFGNPWGTAWGGLLGRAEMFYMQICTKTSCSCVKNKGRKWCNTASFRMQQLFKNKKREKNGNDFAFSCFNEYFLPDSVHKSSCRQQNPATGIEAAQFAANQSRFPL